MGTPPLWVCRSSGVWAESEGHEDEQHVLQGPIPCDKITSMIPTLQAPELKRLLLHQLIDELPAEEPELVERLLARLEMDRLWQ